MAMVVFGPLLMLGLVESVKTTTPTKFRTATVQIAKQILRGPTAQDLDGGKVWAIHQAMVGLEEQPGLVLEGLALLVVITATQIPVGGHWG